MRSFQTAACSEDVTLCVFLLTGALHHLLFLSIILQIHVNLHAFLSCLITTAKPSCPASLSFTSKHTASYASSSEVGFALCAFFCFFFFLCYPCLLFYYDICHCYSAYQFLRKSWTERAERERTEREEADRKQTERAESRETKQRERAERENKEREWCLLVWDHHVSRLSLPSPLCVCLCLVTFTLRPGALTSWRKSVCVYWHAPPHSFRGFYPSLRLLYGPVFGC